MSNSQRFWVYSAPLPPFMSDSFLLWKRNVFRLHTIALYSAWIVSTPARLRCCFTSTYTLPCRLDDHELPDIALNWCHTIHVMYVVHLMEWLRGNIYRHDRTAMPYSTVLISQKKGTNRKKVHFDEKKTFLCEKVCYTAGAVPVPWQS